MNVRYKNIAIIIVLFSLLSTACKSKQSITKTHPKKETPCCIGNYTNYEFVPLIELGKEFRRLKNLQEACCEKRASALYLVMKELGKQLGQKNTHKDKIFEVMGRADVNNNQEIQYKLGNTKAGLSFTLKDNIVTHYKWLDLPKI